MAKVQTAEFLFLLQKLSLGTPTLSSLGSCCLKAVQIMQFLLSLYLFPNCGLICHIIACMKGTTFVTKQMFMAVLVLTF